MDKSLKRATKYMVDLKIFDLNSFSLLKSNLEAIQLSSSTQTQPPSPTLASGPGALSKFARTYESNLCMKFDLNLMSPNYIKHYTENF